MNQRRKLMAALGAGALSAPFAARAQAPGAAAGKIWRVGFDISILRVDGDQIVNTGKSQALPGQPASMRGRTR